MIATTAEQMAASNYKAPKEKIKKCWGERRTPTDIPERGRLRDSRLSCPVSYQLDHFPLGSTDISGRRILLISSEESLPTTLPAGLWMDEATSIAEGKGKRKLFWRRQDSNPHP